MHIDFRITVPWLTMGGVSFAHLLTVVSVVLIQSSIEVVIVGGAEIVLDTGQPDPTLNNGTVPLASAATTVTSNDSSLGGYDSDNDKVNSSLRLISNCTWSNGTIVVGYHGCPPDNTTSATGGGEQAIGSPDQISAGGRPAIDGGAPNDSTSAPAVVGAVLMNKAGASGYINLTLAGGNGTGLGVVVEGEGGEGSGEGDEGSGHLDSLGDAVISYPTLNKTIQLTPSDKNTSSSVVDSSEARDQKTDVVSRQGAAAVTELSVNVLAGTGDARGAPVTSGQAANGSAEDLSGWTTATAATTAPTTAPTTPGRPPSSGPGVESAPPETIAPSADAAPDALPTSGFLHTSGQLSTQVAVGAVVDDVTRRIVASSDSRSPTTKFDFQHVTSTSDLKAVHIATATQPAKHVSNSVKAKLPPGLSRHWGATSPPHSRPPVSPRRPRPRHHSTIRPMYAAVEGAKRPPYRGPHVHEPTTDHRLPTHSPLRGDKRVYPPHSIHGLIWEDRQYVLSVLVPIGCGILGALLIVCVAYAVHTCKADKRSVPLTAASLKPDFSHHIDQILLLADTSEDDD